MIYLLMVDGDATMRSQPSPDGWTADKDTARNFLAEATPGYTREVYKLLDGGEVKYARMKDLL